MKNNPTKLFLFALGLLLAVNSQAQTYSVTNDLGVNFTVGCWTNSGATNITLLSSNVPPGSNVVFTVNTNGTAGVSVQATNAWLGVTVPWTNAPFAGGRVSQLLTTALQLAAPRGLLVPQNQTVLKSYFTTGARPSAADYWELIDTMFWYANQTYSNSLPWTAHSADILPFFGNTMPGTNTVTITSSGLSTNYATVTALAAGGVPPYTYNWSWTFVSSNYMTLYLGAANTYLTASNSATTQLRAKMDPALHGSSALFKLTVQLNDTSNALDSASSYVNFVYP